VENGSLVRLLCLSFADTNVSYGTVVPHRLSKTVILVY
jgi:hypothetical protein